MRSVYKLADKIRTNQPISPVLAALLSAATPVVRVGMWLRCRRPCVRVNARVISFGNITVGGTGKTPAVIERARAEMRQGKKVAVLSRGYGSKQGGKPVVVDTAASFGDLYGILGDEPALIARKLPGIVIVKCPDRAAAAQVAITEHGCDTLILDDGYQHVTLERDENVLVIDATNPFGNGRLIPRGMLREPLEAARRATSIMITRCDQVQNSDRLVAQLQAFCPGVTIRRTRHAPKVLWRLADNAVLPVEELRGKEVNAVCAIGNPDAFFKTVEALGARIVSRTAILDHADIPLGALEARGITVTTEKDAMRMKTAPGNVLALCIELEDV